MAGRKSDFTLPKFDDIFSTQEMRDDEKLAKIRDIPLELIDDFPDHPYKVRDDEDMMQLAESIKERGVITPATVRQKEDGRYELISGHRRKRASELAGFETLRCEVVELDRDDATILMVESNLQRSVILPSEKAHAYKMRLDAMKRKAYRINIPLSILIFVLGWICALFGIFSKFFFFEKLSKITPIVYIIASLIMMGCAVPLLGQMKTKAYLGLGDGNIFYLVGAFFCMLGIKKPFCHAIFHFFVAFASFIHFYVIYTYIF